MAWENNCDIIPVEIFQNNDTGYIFISNKSKVFINDHLNSYLKFNETPLKSIDSLFSGEAKQQILDIQKGDINVKNIKGLRYLLNKDNLKIICNIIYGFKHEKGIGLITEIIHEPTAPYSQEIKELADINMDAIFILDKKKIVFHNRKASELFKNNESQLNGKPFGKLFSQFQNDGKLSDEKFDNFLANASQKHKEIYKWRYDRGNRKHFEGKTTFYKIIDDISIICINDRTVKQKLEKELKQAKELAIESESLKNAFLKNISHELRTPLNAILGFAQLLDYDDSSLKKRREYIGIIKEKSKSLLYLIDDINDLTKLDAQKLNIVKSACKISKVLKETLALLEKEKEKSHKQHIEVKYTIPSNCIDIYYDTDPGRVEQVLSNLLANSLKYTEEGSIEFGFEEVENDMLKFYVKDTGCGIHKDKLPYIFDRFMIIKQPNYTENIGAGLGLAISKGIIELMGGKIWVDSENKKGTTFHFTIQAEKLGKDLVDSNTDIETIEQSKYMWKDKVILVVEDEETNYYLYEEMLEEMKVRVLRAKDGQQAVELCKNIQSIDLILMDIKMPNMDGYEATREIKKTRKNIPIIVQTAYALSDESQKLSELGCDDFISKPIDIELLYSKMNRFLQ